MTQACPALAQPGRVEDWPVGADQQAALLVGVAFGDDFLARRKGAGVATRPGQAVVPGPQDADPPGHPGPGADAKAQVAASPFHARDQAWPHHDATALLGDPLPLARHEA